MLTTEQYKILKKLLKKDIPRDELYNPHRDNSVMEYLSKKNFITEYTKYYYDFDFDSSFHRVREKKSKQYCQITEEGKVEFKTCKEDKYRFWIHTIISLIALFISIMSIYAKPLIWTYFQETFYQSDDVDR